MIDVLCQWLNDRALWWRYERRPPRDRAEAIQHIREHFAALGCPIFDLTDEQIEGGIVAMGDVVRMAGLSAQEFVDALHAIMAAGGSLRMV